MKDDKCECGGNCDCNNDKNENCCGGGCCNNSNNLDIMSKSDILEMKAQLERDLEDVNGAISKK